jgi:hypothetical protein
MREESSGSGLVFGWFLILGIAAILKILPLIIGLILLNYILKRYDKFKTEKNKITEDEESIITYNFDDYSTGTEMAPVEYKETVSKALIEDAISVLVNLRTNKGLAKQAVNEAVENGATTLEEIVKQSLQLLNSHK